MGLFVPNLSMITPNMGMTKVSRASGTQPERISLADALFGGTQQRVLGWVFGQPQRSFYANELIGLIGAGSGGVQRELTRLVQSELVTTKQVGNQKHYQANPASPVFEELCGLAQKTVGLAEPLKAALQPLAQGIAAAFVYGSVAKRQDAASSDIDLMLVSDELNYGELYGALEESSQRLGRKVNPTIYTRAELASRAERGDSFITRVLSQPKIWLVGDDRALGL